LWGGDGNDYLFGDDTLWAGPAMIKDGGAGADDMLGGRGNDLLVDNRRSRQRSLERRRRLWTPMVNASISFNLQPQRHRRIENLNAGRHRQYLWGRQRALQHHRRQRRPTFSTVAFYADTLKSGLSGNDTYVVDNALTRSTRATPARAAWIELSSASISAMVAGEQR
jgi:Ca2+-binding RTX toxin-like protein